MDVVLAAVALGIFMLFFLVLPRGKKISGQALPTVTVPAAQVAMQTGIEAQTSAADSQEQTTGPQATGLGGMWGDKFADKFNADGSVDKTDTTYKSANVNLTLNKVQSNDVTYYTIDIYVRDLKYLKTAFAGDSFSRGSAAPTVEIANANQAVAAISGDYCGTHNDGLVIRNGQLYREDLSDQDVLIMYQDGSMETFSRAQVNVDAIVAKGAYQSWAFGPMLLDANGQAMTEFNSNVVRANPRAAIGYYEPGHYVFVLVDGRQPGYSEGMTMQQLSQLFYDMGCKVAYNLDGGQSAVLTFNGNVANQPYNNGRSISDIIYVADQG